MFFSSVCSVELLCHLQLQKSELKNRVNEKTRYETSRSFTLRGFSEINQSRLNFSSDSVFLVNLESSSCKLNELGFFGRKQKLKIENWRNKKNWKLKMKIENGKLKIENWKKIKMMNIGIKTYRQLRLFLRIWITPNEDHPSFYSSSQA